MLFAEIWLTHNRSHAMATRSEGNTREREIVGSHDHRVCALFSTVTIMGVELSGILLGVRALNGPSWSVYSAHLVFMLSRERRELYTPSEEAAGATI